MNRNPIILPIELELIELKAAIKKSFPTVCINTIIEDDYVIAWLSGDVKYTDRHVQVRNNNNDDRRASMAEAQIIAIHTVMRINALAGGYMWNINVTALSYGQPVMDLGPIRPSNNDKEVVRQIIKESADGVKPPHDGPKALAIVDDKLPQGEKQEGKDGPIAPEATSDETPINSTGPDQGPNTTSGPQEQIEPIPATADMTDEEKARIKCTVRGVHAKELTEKTANKIDGMLTILQANGIVNISKAEILERVNKKKPMGEKSTRIKSETLICEFFGRDVQDFILGRLDIKEFVKDFSKDHVLRARGANTDFGGDTITAGAIVEKTPMAAPARTATNTPVVVDVKTQGPAAPENDGANDTQEEEENNTGQAGGLEVFFSEVPEAEEERFGDDVSNLYETITNVLGFEEEDYKNYASSELLARFGTLDTLIAMTSKEYNEKLLVAIKDHVARA